MRLRFIAAALIACAVGCGHIEYGDSVEEVVEVRTGGGQYVVQGAPRVEYRAHVVPGRQPPPVVAQPAAPPRAGVVTCAGNERIRISEEIVDGRGGPAIVATGGCVVEVDESIIRGNPAVIVRGNARVELVECRVQGDLVSAGAAQIQTQGTAHRGQVLRAAF